VHLAVKCCASARRLPRYPISSCWVLQGPGDSTVGCLDVLLLGCEPCAVCMYVCSSGRLICREGLHAKEAGCSMTWVCLGVWEGVCTAVVAGSVFWYMIGSLPGGPQWSQVAHRQLLYAAVCVHQPMLGKSVRGRVLTVCSCCVVVAVSVLLAVKCHASVRRWLTVRVVWVSWVQDSTVGCHDMLLLGL
jgi:hypothetical protein